MVLKLGEFYSHLQCRLILNDEPRTPGAQSRLGSGLFRGNPQNRSTFTIADAGWSGYAWWMTEKLEYFSPNRLKKFSVAEIQTTIADALSELVEGQNLYAVEIGAIEWGGFDAKMSVRIRPAYLAQTDNQANEVQVEQPAH